MFFLNKNLGENYKSSSQKIRVMTELWTWENIFCPNCWNQILHFENNSPVADFFCKNCNEEYELKSWKSIWKKIIDWAYLTMVERLNSSNNPNFFLLNYNLKTLEVSNFLVIPKHFFVPEIIEKRKPLWENAKRAGWVGCNILYNQIPESWKIFYIKNWSFLDKNYILSSRNKTLFLKEQKLETKGWILDIMKIVDKLWKSEFKLDELYKFENYLKSLYPNNNHIKDKIRQQLQFLRNKGYVEFLWNWNYRLWK